MTSRIAALGLMVALLVGWGRGQLSYLVYDLAEPSKAAVVPEETQLENLAKASSFRTGTQMLFVKDESLGENGVYLGVYEVSQAQAKALGWTAAVSSGDEGVAFGFGGTDFTTACTLTDFPALSFPTLAQWQAYAGEPKRPCNVYEGIAEGWPLLPSLKDWLAGSLNGSYALEASHGVYDIYGNVAEYTQDGAFRGGYADYSCTFGSLSVETTAVANGFRGARLVYTPPEAQRYAVKVYLNGAQVGETQYAKEGDEVAISEPALAEGYRMTGLTVEGLDEPVLSFAMPACAVSFYYTSRAYVNVITADCTASAGTPLVGEQLTLKATLGKYQCVRAWTLPTGTAEPEAEITYTIPEDVAAGSTLTFRATAMTYPRVCVYGGTVTLKSGTGSDLGEGYYTPGAVLTLSAGSLSGYTFQAWSASPEAEVSGNSWTVGDYDTAYTLTATYAVDTSSPIENAAETKVGEDETGLLAAVTLGYTQGTGSQSQRVAGNTFIYYPTAEPTGDYANLGLTAKSVTYAEREPGNTLGRTTLLPLKRIKPTGERPYYVGIYETTEAHCARLKALAVPSEEEGESTLTSSAKPQKIESKAEAETFLGYIKTAFGCTATLPTKAQIETITKCGLDASEKETYQGAGHKAVLDDDSSYGDPKITSAMIVYGQGNAAAYLATGSRTVDPYGFYDLWGNVSEVYADGNLWGGNAGETAPTTCNLQEADDTFTWLFGGFRPVVTVPEKVSVEIWVDGQALAGEAAADTWTVLPGQQIRLAPQVLAGKTFVGWQATVGETTTALTAGEDGYTTYAVSEAVKLEARFTDERPAFRVSYAGGCTGPASVLPGTATRIYAESASGAQLLGVQVDPVSAATWNAETGMLTFAESGVCEVTVTAEYAAPVVPGYRVRLY